MRAELIFIGTELLLGQILNTNAKYLSQELCSIGIDCYYQTTVGDNPQRIIETIHNAFTRADLVITSGGLGPTSDDITVECCAKAFDEELVLEESIVQQIFQKFNKKNLKMPESNKKQALRPQTARFLNNSIGTAPGLYWEIPTPKTSSAAITKKILLCFPGVPKELEIIWKEEAKALLIQELGGINTKLFQKEIKFYGIGESAMAEKVQDLLDLEDPTVAPLTGQSECKLRIATKSNNSEISEEKINKTVQEIKNRIGEFIYGYDEDTLESVVANKLIEFGKTISIAESCTGGLLSKRLTDIPGSSQFINLNLVTYSNQSKINLLKVSAETINKYGVVSAQVAIEMAEGIEKLTNSDIAIAITGIAGPIGDTPEKPIGKVYYAICSNLLSNPLKRIISYELNLGNIGRENIRWKTTQEILFKLIKEYLS